jgi:hypothetical protein
MNYKESWEKAMAANEYLALVERVVEEGKTTGPNQSEDLAGYTKLNFQRMKRVAKTTKSNADLLQTLSDQKHDLAFLIITEAWCGDAAQSVPVFTKLAQESGVEVKLALRDENPELIDQHLTNGGRSIPIVIALDKSTFKPLFSWGPRPIDLQKIVIAHRDATEPKAPYSEFVQQVQLWYTKDKQQAIQAELKLSLDKNLSLG